MSHEEMNTARRTFLKSSAAISGGLIIGFYLPGPVEKAFGQAAGKTPVAYPPNAFIRIAPDSSVTFVINKCEMGQGVFTSMAQLLAEELDCDWTKVRSVGAHVDPVYNHTMFGMMQMTGGSTALASSYDQHRKIGATARAMLMEAAAKKWGVEKGSLSTENGFVVHPQKGKLSYGELSDAANQLPMPKDVPVKSPKQFRLIGHSVPRVDAAEKSTGKAEYGIDVRIPKLVRVMVLRPPAFGATLKSFDAADAKKVPGVIDAVRVGDRVAVVGKNSWAARKGRDALKAEWNMNGKESVTSASLMASYKKDAEKPSITPQANPDAVKVAEADKHALFAEYEFPYLAHAAMEPLNVTVNYDGKSAELWSGHQMPTLDRDSAAKVFGLPNDKVKVNCVLAGGSFGRRASKDSAYVIEACEIAKVLKRPIQVLHSREDDMKAGYYRPLTYHRARIATEKSGHPKAWHHTVVSQSIMRGGAFSAMMGAGGDPTVTEGVSESPYSIGKMHIDMHMPDHDIPVLWFRSVGHTHTGYVMETLMDELAHRAKKDPLDYRKSLLQKSPRHLAVIDLLKKVSPWGKKAPQGHAYGVAVHQSFNTVVGHVAEVSIENGKPKVHRVWSAVHCGKVVNPDGARTQVEGAIAFGLSAALYGNIEIANGGSAVTNFDTYPVLRMNEMPKTEVHFVTSEESPTGLGEPGVPPIAPAVANALFILNGKRIRKLPMQLES